MKVLVPDESLSQQFHQRNTAFERAAKQALDGVEGFHFVFGGHTIRLSVAGRPLARQIACPFAHLAIDARLDRPPRLEIRLWDEQDTGICASRAPACPNDEGLDECTEISETGRFVQHRTPHSIATMDRATGQIVGAVRASGGIDAYHRGKPLARLLTEWYADQGVGVMHAALVARGERGVLLAGKGGSGKSTLALACARAGFDFLGEDYAALEFLSNGSIVGHSAYNSVFLSVASAAWFPEVVPYLTPSRDAREPKSVVMLWDVWPSRLRPSVSVRALALCRVARTPACRVRPASKPEALLAVAPSSLLEIHGRRRDSLDRLARVVQRVPCFHLEIGQDLNAAPAAIDEILELIDRIGPPDG